MDEANLNMDDADDDGTFVPTGGRQPQALLLSSLDSMCAQFALRTVCAMGLRFNLRTNINDILTVCAPELIWPVTVIQRLQRFLSARCADMPGWRAVGKLDLPTFMDRHGQWSSAFDEGSLFYYLDEYVKHHAKDMFTVFGASCDALGE
ncbi:MAG TPA: ATPase, partial [Ralstonia sp.]|nr:ATPase [Ralstonia sp.]